ncbi:hypothetical protein RUM44_010156 [Polyplax serrata]|uniref:Uncharacterized protein n=1 Tax=Polyplax serrata TaxID=468196 RepID=A0ABR1AWI6_POLSC
MYEGSCSYQSALDLKRVTSGCSTGVSAIKTEDCMNVAGLGTNDWAGCAYRFACNSSTFEQLKQSVEKAKAALQDRGNYLAASSAFSDFATSSFTSGPRTNENLPDLRREDADKRTQIDMNREWKRIGAENRHGNGDRKAFPQTKTS